MMPTFCVCVLYFSLNVMSDGRLIGAHAHMPLCMCVCVTFVQCVCACVCVGRGPGVYICVQRSEFNTS